MDLNSVMNFAYSQTINFNNQCLRLYDKLLLFTNKYVKKYITKINIFKILNF